MVRDGAEENLHELEIAMQRRNVERRVATIILEVGVRVALAGHMDHNINPVQGAFG